MRTTFEPTIVLGIVLLNAYCFGANFVERFVNYQTWSFIPADAFKAYHRAQQPLIQAFVVAPMSSDSCSKSGWFVACLSASTRESRG